MVKRLRHRPFTAVTRVRFPSESLIIWFADVAHFMTIEEWSESIVGKAADYKSADIGFADVAQLAEQLICNQQVIGSSPIIGFILFL